MQQWDLFSKTGKAIARGVALRIPRLDSSGLCVVMSCIMHQTWTHFNVSSFFIGLIS